MRYWRWSSSRAPLTSASRIWLSRSVENCGLQVVLEWKQFCSRVIECSEVVFISSILLKLSRVVANQCSVVSDSGLVNRNALQHDTEHLSGPGLLGKRHNSETSRTRT